MDEQELIMQLANMVGDCPACGGTGLARGVPDFEGSQEIATQSFCADCCGYEGNGKIPLFPLLRLRCPGAEIINHFCQGGYLYRETEDGWKPLRGKHHLCQGHGWTVEDDPLRVVAHVDEVMMGLDYDAQRGFVDVDGGWFFAVYDHDRIGLGEHKRFGGGEGPTNLLATLKAAMEAVKGQRAEATDV